MARRHDEALSNSTFAQIVSTRNAAEPIAVPQLNGTHLGDAYGIPAFNPVIALAEEEAS
jgi:hypothetical protein